VRGDDYAWLSDRTPEVVDLLRDENAWTAQATAHLAPLCEQLLAEYHHRVQETDNSAPLRKGAWWYTTRTEEGRPYPMLCRRRDAGAQDEVMLDLNAVAAELHADYLAVETEVSPDGDLLAYAVDRDGSEEFEIHFRDLTSGRDLPDVVPGAYYGMAWATGALWYVRTDEAVRPFQAWVHRLGTPSDQDVCVFEEADARFELSLELGRSGSLIVVHLESKMATEVWIADAAAPTPVLRVVEPRRQGVEYSVEPQGDRLLVVTNADGATDFKVVEAPLASPGRTSWREVVPHRPGTRVEAVVAFAHHAVRLERCDGLLRLVVMGASADIAAAREPDSAYAIDLVDEGDYDAGVARYRSSSPVRPTETVDLDLATGSRRVVKRETVHGWDPEAYEVHRLVAGDDVPLTVVHRRGIALDGTHPTLLYGYGSYEHSIDPGWSALRVSLLERGVIWAVAHVRGGGERGRRWYEEGRLAAKPATFADFVACAEHLVDAGYTSRGLLAARGASAGGLLVGAVTNMRPDLWTAVVAEVPFVDALNTILDPTLPLTVTEWEEWGNPVDDAEIYDVMASYSPYDNVHDAPYPAVLATAGLNDPRVSYWEPAKWVQRLRRHTTSGAPVLLRVELGAGHSGPSGRYEAWADEAFVQAFMLDRWGLGPGASG